METTHIWEKYQRGRDHHARANLCGQAEMCHRFFEGDQWYGLESGGEKLPMYNFIQPTCEYKIAMVALKNLAITYAPEDKNGGSESICAALNCFASRTWEHAKMDRRIWEMVKEACIAGDSFIFFYDGSFHSQLIDTADIFLADEQQRDIQKQQYIILHERRLVSDVREEARRNGVSEDDIESITGDEGSAHSYDSNEVKTDLGKCSCLLYLTKKDGFVSFTRAAKTVVYQPETVVEGMTLYPVAYLTWLPQKGTARGRGEIWAMIPNQIETNRLLVRRLLSAKQTAFPKPVFSSRAVENRDSVEKIGASVMVDGSVQRVQDAFTYVQAAPMASDAQLLQNEMVATTQRMASAGDAALGNVNPERASGAAIVAARDQSAIPLNEQSAALRQFAEDIAHIWLDMLCAYFPQGLAAEEGSGRETVPVDELRALQMTVRVDVSPVDPYSRYAQQQQLLSMLSGGLIAFDEFVEALDDDTAIPKSKLENILRRRKELAAKQALQLQGGALPVQTGGVGGGGPADLQMPQM